MSYVECYVADYPGRILSQFYRIVIEDDGSGSYPDGFPWMWDNLRENPRPAMVREVFKRYGFTRRYGLAINSYALNLPGDWEIYT